MHVLATAKAVVLFKQLPDAAIAEIVAPYNFSGNRNELLAKLSHLVHQRSVGEVMDMIAAMKPIAVKYGLPDAVTIHDR